ncbi:MAG: tetratricopeptide repeat protein [Xanthomonadales bacterium]|jgi:tetratricopeptide (TPR) repeat protein|nr:tetratricopeptide repeat protein [Xanthomonadales bacterium]
MHARSASLWFATLLCAAVLLMLLVAPIPAHAAGELARAQAAVEAGRLKEALPLLDAAIAAEPARAGAFLLRGIVRFELQQWDPALADYEAALRLDPGNAEAWYRRGYWWAADAKDRKALPDYERAIALDPANSRYLYARATAYERLRDWRRAAEAYQAVLLVDPTHAEAARDLQGVREKLGPAAAGVPGAAPVAVAPPKTPPPTPSVQVERDDPAAGSVDPGAVEPASVLQRVLDAQAKGDLAALEREWDLAALGPQAEQLQRARLRAVAAKLRIDGLRMRERATLYSEDGRSAMVRAEVSFRATHASGVSRWANGVIGVLRRAGTGAATRWTVVGVIPDELLNGELAERAESLGLQRPLPDSRRSQWATAPVESGTAGAGASLLGRGVFAASLLAAAQGGGTAYARPMTYAQLNRELDAAMNREYGLTKLKFVANGLNTQFGQVPGAGDVVSFIYQGVDIAQNSMEVLGETMKHGFTPIGGLKVAQVFAGVVQMVSELVPPADVASDLFQYRLETITANAEIRRTVDHLRLDLASGRLKPSGARLRVAEGRRYPPGVRLQLENAGDVLMDPRDRRSVGIGFEGGVVRVLVTTPEMLQIESPRLPFEVAAQVVIDPGNVRYEAFDERAAKVLGAVQRGDRWAIPVLMGVYAAADASSGAAVLADFQRMRLSLDQGEHPDRAATWAWQPCRGTQKLAVQLQDGSRTLPAVVRNDFLNALTRLAVVDAQGQPLSQLTLGPGESRAGLTLIGLDARGTSLNLTPFIRRRLACVTLTAPDAAVVTARANLKAFSLAAVAAGSTRLGLTVSGDAGTPDLVLDLPVRVTGGQGGWRLAEVERSDTQTPVMLNHRQQPNYADTGLMVSCGAKLKLPEAGKREAEWPVVGYDAEVRVQWGAMPAELVVGQRVRVAATVSRRFEPMPGWLGDPPAAAVRIGVPEVPDATAEAGGSAEASFVVPEPRPGATLGISVSASACSAYSKRVFIYRPAGES